MSITINASFPSIVVGLTCTATDIRACVCLCVWLYQYLGVEVWCTLGLKLQSQRLRKLTLGLIGRCMERMDPKRQLQPNIFKAPYLSATESSEWRKCWPPVSPGSPGSDGGGQGPCICCLRRCHEGVDDVRDQQVGGKIPTVPGSSVRVVRPPRRVGTVYEGRPPHTRPQHQQRGGGSIQSHQRFHPALVIYTTFVLRQASESFCIWCNDCLIALNIF